MKTSEQRIGDLDSSGHGVVHQDGFWNCQGQAKKIAAEHDAVMAKMAEVLSDIAAGGLDAGDSALAANRVLRAYESLGEK